MAQDLNFKFIIPDSIRGLCSITIPAATPFQINVIASGENVMFTTTYFQPVQKMVITSSEENKTYYKYLQHPEVLKTPSAKVKSSLAYLYYQLRVPASVNVTGSSDNRLYQRDHFLDNTNLNNSNIIYTDLLIPKIFDFIRLFDNGYLPFDQQADTLCLALDQLLSRVAKNETVYNFIVTQLSNQFRYGNYDILCAYLTKYYGSKFMLAKNHPATQVRARLNAVNHPTIGQTAPDIIMKQAGSDSTFKLSSISANYTLIVFWSTYCSHCIQSLPLLKRIYDARQGSFEILAISFDTDKDAWQQFIAANNFGWINYTDLRGWESEIAGKYDVQGTPTYILLDKNKTIISKPVELTDLAGELQRLKII